MVQIHPQYNPLFTDHHWFYKRPILMETIGASLEIVLTTFF